MPKIGTSSDSRNKMWIFHVSVKRVTFNVVKRQGVFLHTGQLVIHFCWNKINDRIHLILSGRLRDHLSSRIVRFECCEIMIALNQGTIIRWSVAQPSLIRRTINLIILLVKSMKTDKLCKSNIRGFTLLWFEFRFSKPSKTTNLKPMCEIRYCSLWTQALTCLKIYNAMGGLRNIKEYMRAKSWSCSEHSWIRMHCPSKSR